MSAPFRSRLRAIGRRALTVTTTAAILAGAGGLVVGGMALIPAGAAVPATAAAVAPPMPVAVAQVRVLPGHPVTRRFAGQVEAAAETALGFELGGRLALMV